MNSFSALERNIARFLGRNLFIKNKVKRLYQMFLYLIYREAQKLDTELRIDMCGSFYSQESFFGYYDKSPDNNHGQILIIEKINEIPPGFEDSSGTFLRVYDGTRVIYSEEIDTYNYQQGCRAHWLTDDKFIFNVFCQDLKRVVSKVVSLQGETETRILPYPVQDSYKDQFYISLNYDRLNAITPEYGYSVPGSSTSSELNCLEADGLWVVEMPTGLPQRFLSLEDILSCGWRSEFQNAKHLVNHVMISPNGLSCIFIHRYFCHGMRIDRLMHLDLNSFELKTLVDNGYVSHCCWLNDDKILGYMRDIEGIDQYKIINLNPYSLENLGDLQIGKFGDGHPTVNGDLVVFDTYPDRSRMQNLVICNWKTGDWKVLGRFHSGLRFVEEKRCDLHPRFSRNDNSIFIDGTFDGSRQLYRVSLNGI